MSIVLRFIHNNFRDVFPHNVSTSVTVDFSCVSVMSDKIVSWSEVARVSSFPTHVTSAASLYKLLEQSFPRMLYNGLSVFAHMTHLPLFQETGSILPTIPFIRHHSKQHFHSDSWTLKFIICLRSTCSIYLCLFYWSNYWSITLLFPMSFFFSSVLTY